MRTKEEIESKISILNDIVKLLDNEVNKLDKTILNNYDDSNSEYLEEIELETDILNEVSKEFKNIINALEFVIGKSEKFDCDLICMGLPDKVYELHKLLSK